MIMGVVIRGRKYTWQEYSAVFLITAGISIFQYGKMSTSSSVGNENSSYGFFLLFLSLFCDGVTGPNQEKINIEYAPSVHQQMAYTNAWAFGYTLVAAAVTGQGASGLTFVLENSELWTPLCGFALCSAFGQNFIFFTIQEFSALTCTTITTTRKFLYVKYLKKRATHWS